MLQQQWVGRRVSVRRVVERAPDGRLLLGDVVGRLAGLDAQTAVLDTRTGLVEVPVALVTAARVVPPSTLDELQLQDIAARGWPAAETVQLDGWLLRADPGGTSRANSVLPSRQLRMPFSDALEQVRAFYAKHGRPALFQVASEGRRLLGAELAERGWQPERLTSVLVTELRGDSQQASAAGGVHIGGEPDPGWLALASGGDGDAADRRALLTRHPGTAFATARDAGEVVATGRATVDDGWLGITTVEVAAGRRREGLASGVTAALQAWGRGRGAERAYVQVVADNEAALRLYERLGYRAHHDYHYLREPDVS